MAAWSGGHSSAAGWHCPGKGAEEGPRGKETGKGANSGAAVPALSRDGCASTRRAPLPGSRCCPAARVLCPCRPPATRRPTSERAHGTCVLLLLARLLRGGCLLRRLLRWLLRWCLGHSSSSLSVAYVTLDRAIQAQSPLCSLFASAPTVLRRRHTVFLRGLAADSRSRARANAGVSAEYGIAIPINRTRDSEYRIPVPRRTRAILIHQTVGIMPWGHGSSPSPSPSSPSSSSSSFRFIGTGRSGGSSSGSFSPSPSAGGGV